MGSFLGSGVDDAFGNWLAGFIDGEGSFSIWSRPAEGSLSCGFQLDVREDDAEVVREIHARLGIGRVRRIDRRPPRTDHPQIRWSVDSKADCVALLEFLERYPLRAKKARDLAVWRKAVAEWARVFTRNRRGGERWDWSYMAELKRELQDGRRYEAACEGEAVGASDRPGVDQLLLEVV